MIEQCVCTLLTQRVIDVTLPRHDVEQIARYLQKSGTVLDSLWLKPLTSRALLCLSCTICNPTTLFSNPSGPSFLPLTCGSGSPWSPRLRPRQLAWSCSHFLWTSSYNAGQISGQWHYQVSLATVLKIRFFFSGELFYLAGGMYFREMPSCLLSTNVSCKRHIMNLS